MLPRIRVSHKNNLEHTVPYFFFAEKKSIHTVDEANVFIEK